MTPQEMLKANLTARGADPEEIESALATLKSQGFYRDAALFIDIRTSSTSKPVVPPVAEDDTPEEP